MTAKSPAFQFYPDSFVSGAPAFMKPLETHVYIWLMCLEWTRNGFSLDERNLASWCRISVAQFRHAWVKVSPSFIERDGKFYHPRLDAERDKQRSYSERMSLNGKKGGRRKADVKPDESRGLADVKLDDESQQSRGKAVVKHSVSISNSVTTTATTKATTSRRQKRDELPDPPKVTWLSPLCAVWESHNGAGSFAGVAGQAAKALAPIERAGNTPLEMADHLENYMAANDPKFWNVTKFAQTYRQWEAKELVVDGEWSDYGDKMTRAVNQ